MFLLSLRIGAVFLVTPLLSASTLPVRVLLTLGFSSFKRIINNY